MNILVTGAHGFLGKHLCLDLESLGHNVLKYGRDDVDLDFKVQKSDFIYHLAGVNRTDDTSLFKDINIGLTNQLIEEVKKRKTNIPIVFASSYQALLDTPYGISKRQAEDALLDFYKTTQNPIYIYRLPGIFGKWSKPYYNTVVATFIHQVHHDLELTIHDPNTIIEIVYVDDVVKSFIHHLESPSNEIYQDVKPIHTVTLSELAKTLKAFKSAESDNLIPDLKDAFIKKLYSTYISFKPQHQWVNLYDSKFDERGSFTELLKSEAFGQMSVNITKPGVEKGHHYHHHKHEKFIVVSGEGEIQIRDFFENEIQTIKVSNSKLEVVEIPPGFVHSIKNTGSKDLITLMWANEIFDANNPDTHFKKV